MNVYLSHTIHGGTGDQIWSTFCRQSPWSRHLVDLLAGFRSGRFDRIAVVPKEAKKPANPEAFPLFHALGVQVRAPRDVEGWTRVEDITSTGPLPSPVRVPTVQPPFAVPRRFVLLNQCAAGPDRCIDDPRIYRVIKEATRLPVVKVGSRSDLDPIPCDLDLSGKLNLPQVAWLAKRALCVVTALTMHRNWTWAFGTPVIEIAQTGRVIQPTIDSANRDYRERRFGMGQLNYWLTWPNAEPDLRRVLDLCLRREHDGITTLWP